MSSDQPVVIVKNLYKSFKLPHEQSSGIKEVVVRFFSRKKGYEIQEVLKDVSFNIQKGEFFGIVGRNGSGKSTLLKLLGGIYTPDKGLVQVNGSLTPFIELGVGFNPELTGRENVYLNGALLGFSRKQMDDMYDDIVEFAEIERFMDQKLKNYSSGMQVRLAFSIAIRADSDILLIDEVLAVGDSAFQQKCFDYFTRLRREKKTIILVTHDMSAVKRFCTSAMYVKDGEIITYGKPSDVADVYSVENIESTNEHAENKDDGLSKKHSVDIIVTKESNSTLDLQFVYESPDENSMYVGTSILSNGVSVAEMTTPLSMSIKGAGKVAFQIDKTLFNQGVYELTVVLCEKSTRKLISIGKHKITFIVKGDDITRGGALKLKDTWRTI
jgi:ABC-2 type transport system ATP-binding protein